MRAKFILLFLAELAEIAEKKRISERSQGETHFLIFDNVAEIWNLLTATRQEKILCVLRASVRALPFTEHLGLKRFGCIDNARDSVL